MLEGHRDVPRSDGDATESKDSDIPFEDLKNGIDFLGFHIYLTETGKTVWKIRRRSKSNMSRKLKKFRKLLDRGLITMESIHQSYQSWKGHALRGNCHHLVREMDELYNSLFKEDNKDVSITVESADRGESQVR